MFFPCPYPPLPVFRIPIRRRTMTARRRSRTPHSGASSPITWSRSATRRGRAGRSEEHTSELQSLMRISYAVFCLKKKKDKKHNISIHTDEYISLTYKLTYKC